MFNGSALVRLISPSIRCSPCRMVGVFTNEKAEPDLFEHTVSVRTRYGDSVPIRCVFQDLKPLSKAIGTVVAVHGAPGSHKDFKYIAPLLIEKNIRFIGVNWPGMGYSSYDNRLADDNQERVQIVQQLVEELGLQEPLVFAGHSRGSENALKMAAENPDKTKAAVLINPIGLRQHRGIKPYWLVCAIGWVWKHVPFAQLLLNPLLLRLYNRLGLRTTSGQTAGVSIHLMWWADFAGQRPFIERVNQSDVRVLTAFAGKDFLVEKAVSRELTTAFEHYREFVCATSSEDPETEGEVEKAIKGGERHLSVLFEQDGHFLQKTRAVFLADAISWLLKADQKSSYN